MTKKEAKVVALRKITAIVGELPQTEMLEGFEEKDRLKIEAAIEEYAKEFYARAARLGGVDFNKYGYI